MVVVHILPPRPILLWIATDELESIAHLRNSVSRVRVRVE